MIASIISHLWATSSRKRRVGLCQGLGLCHGCVSAGFCVEAVSARPASQTRVLRSRTTQGGYRGEWQGGLRNPLSFRGRPVPPVSGGRGQSQTPVSRVGEVLRERAIFHDPFVPVRVGDTPPANTEALFTEQPVVKRMKSQKFSAIFS